MRCPQADGGQLALYNWRYSGQRASCATGCGSGVAAGLAEAAGPEEAGASSWGAGVAGGEPALLVAPLGGRLLVFESHLDHEVLPAHQRRYSVTLWLYRGDAAGDASSAGRGSAADSRGVSSGCNAACAVSGAGSSGCAGGAAGEAKPRAVLYKQPSLVSGAEAERARGRIFVAIPAYRDPEAAWTLRDLFLKAAFPERVFTGVFWQVRQVGRGHTGGTGPGARRGEGCVWLHCWQYATWRHGAPPACTQGFPSCQPQGLLIGPRHVLLPRRP